MNWEGVIPLDPWERPLGTSRRYLLTVWTASGSSVQGTPSVVSEAPGPLVFPSKLMLMDDLRLGHMRNENTCEPKTEEGGMR